MATEDKEKESETKLQHKRKIIRLWLGEYEGKAALFNENDEPLLKSDGTPYKTLPKSLYPSDLYITQVVGKRILPEKVVEPQKEESIEEPIEEPNQLIEEPNQSTEQDEIETIDPPIVEKKKKKHKKKKKPVVVVSEEEDEDDVQSITQEPQVQSQVQSQIQTQEQPLWKTIAWKAAVPIGLLLIRSVVGYLASPQQPNMQQSQVRIAEVQRQALLQALEQRRKQQEQSQMQLDTSVEQLLEEKPQTETQVIWE